MEPPNRPGRPSLFAIPVSTRLIALVLAFLLNVALFHGVNAYLGSRIEGHLRGGLEIGSESDAQTAKFRFLYTIAADLFPSKQILWGAAIDRQHIAETVRFRSHDHALWYGKEELVGTLALLRDDTCDHGSLASCTEGWVPPGGSERLMYRGLPFKVPPVWSEGGRGKAWVPPFCSEWGWKINR